MADGIIDRQDLITDGALRVGKELAESLYPAEDELDKVIELAFKHKQVTDDQAESIRQLTRKIDSLEKEQKNLSEVNRKLEEQVRKNTEATKRQGEAMEALDNRVGGAITRFKMLGKELLALAKSPAILVLGALVALFAALTKSVKIFYETTGEGEDMLDKQAGVWEQFFATLRKKWSNFGKDIAQSSSDISRNIAIGFLSLISTDLALEFQKAVKERERLIESIDAIEEETIANIVKNAETEREVNKLVLESQDKLKYSDEQRLALLQRAIQLKEEQLSRNVNVAKQEAENVLLMIGLEHDLTKDRVKSMTEAERLAEFTAEENRKIAEAYAKSISLEAAYYGEVRKNAGKIIALKEEIHKEEVKKAEERASEFLDIQMAFMNQEIEQVQKAVIEGVNTRENGDKEILEIKKKYAAKLIQAQIDGLDELLKSSKLSDAEEIEALKKLNALKIELTETLYEQIKDVEVKGTKITAEEIVEAYMEAFSSLTELLDSFTENRMAAIDLEEERLERFYDRQIELAGDNAEAKKQIERDYDQAVQAIERRRLEAQRRAAIFDKIVSAIQAAIATALAVTRLLDKPPLAIAAGIAGGLQVAAILAKQIPQYEVGTLGKPHRGGLAVVGEKGSELMHVPGKGFSFSPNSTTLMNLPKGTEVFSNEDTMRMLALSGLMDSFSSNRQMLSTDTKEIVKAIKELQPVRIPDFVRVHNDIYKVIKSKDGSKQYIRSKVMPTP